MSIYIEETHDSPFYFVIMVDLFKEYKNERGSVALKKEELLKIDAHSSNQPCSMFGLHPSLTRLQSMYNQRDALFLANIGVLNQPVSSSNYAKLTDVQLFAHNASKWLHFFAALLRLFIL